MRSLLLAGLALVLVACADPAPVAPTARLPHAPAFALAAPSGIAVDSVVDMTVYARWQDNASDNGGYYLVLSGPTDPQDSRKYQIVYGGDATSGSITAYPGEQGCYLVSVFAWGFGDTDSQWATTGPVAVGVATDCAAAGVAGGKRKGHR